MGMGVNVLIIGVAIVLDVAVFLGLNFAQVGSGASIQNCTRSVFMFGFLPN